MSGVHHECFSAFGEALSGGWQTVAFVVHFAPKIQNFRKCDESHIGSADLGEWCSERV